MTHAEWEGGGLNSAGPAPRWAQARSGARPLCQLKALSWGSVRALGASSYGFARAQTPLLVRKGSVPTELWIK